MDFKWFCGKLALLLYRVGIPGVFIFFTVVTWKQATICDIKRNLCLCLVFAVGIERVVVFLRYCLKSKALEFECTIVMLSIYIMNILEKHGCELANPPAFLIMSQALFDIILLGNLAGYLAAIFVLIIFGIVLICHVMRGSRFGNFNISSGGLNDREMSYLYSKTYGEILDEELVTEATCSICMTEFTAADVTIMLPGCDHTYHEDCIREWLILNEHCPICRNNVRNAITNEYLVPVE